MKTLKPIKKFEGIYSINRLGQVWSCRSNSFLKEGRNQRGYLHVSLYVSNQRTTKRIHRLVAETFIINTENKPQVNHIDGDKKNNHADNLEWCTQSENITHAFSIGLDNHRGVRNPNAKLTGKDVLNIRELVENTSTDEVAKKYKVSTRTINRIASGQAWAHLY